MAKRFPYYAVMVGKTKKSCHKKKASAKKRAKSLRDAGRKHVRVSGRKSCG